MNEFAPKVKVREELNSTLSFEELLIRSRNLVNKSRSEVAEFLGVGIKTLGQWEAHGGSIVFPKKELLPRIAAIYQIDLTELTNAFNTSKIKRGILNDTRKNKQKTRKRSEDDFGLPDSSNIKRGHQY